MPSKNRIKQYVEDGYYHIYNRGVEKRITFLDEKDYVVFLYFLKLYLLPLSNNTPKTLSNLQYTRIKKTFFEEVELHAFCLMPNHFHLLIHQKNRSSITAFMRALITSYVMYFNKKYKRVGSLFQGNYKAVLVTKDPYILHLSRYIHANPLHLSAGSDPERLVDYPYSSYPYYLGKRHAAWITRDFILSFFETNGKEINSQIESYKKFVEDYSYELGKLPDKLLLEDPEE
jgi:putative transposase